MVDLPNEVQDARQSAFYEDMIARHGPLLSGPELVRALGFRNAAALRQARLRGHVTVPVFSLPNRKGPFAMTRDVADWLCCLTTHQGEETRM